MGFLQTSGGAGLAFHPLAEDGVSAEAFGEKFDRHGPLFDGVFGLVDLTHPTAAQQPFQVVGPNIDPAREACSSLIAHPSNPTPGPPSRGNVADARPIVDP